ncbi:MAG: ABC transporter permease [Verrucomicrobiales bacterium]|nr:ABC transporter permease [Verrucomicrobiales bacterium]
MRAPLQRFFSAYGMIGVLLALCVFFSTVTYTKQAASGLEAAEEIASRIPKGASVTLIGSDTAEDQGFTDLLIQALARRGMSQVKIVLGEPQDARRALAELAKSPEIHAVVRTEKASRWLVFEDVATEFPSLSDVPWIQPRSYFFPNFLKADNLLNIANQIAVIAIVAIGMTMVIIAGGIDLSVGSLIALSAVGIAVGLRDYGGGTAASSTAMVACGIAAVAVCGLAGAFSGFMVTRFAIPPFIVTLGMMLVSSGLAYTLAEGQSISAMPDSFTWLGRGTGFLGLPIAVLLMFALYVAAHLVMSQMRFGRYLYAVGGNVEAAALSGVPVKRVIALTYVISGLLAGLGGVLFASQLKSGSPTYGTMYELYVIAAAVVGGTSLSGGKGRMFGTLIGAFTIAVIQNGMNLTNVESYTQKVVLGLVILGAVLMDKTRQN